MLVVDVSELIEAILTIKELKVLCVVCVDTAVHRQIVIHAIVGIDIALTGLGKTQSLAD
jgi:hypothetical protein